MGNPARLMSLARAEQTPIACTRPSNCRYCSIDQTQQNHEVPCLEGQGRQFLGAAYVMLHSWPAQLAIKVVTSTLPTMNRVHQWDPGKPAVCSCCKQQNETYAHMQLSCPQLLGRPRGTVGKASASEARGPGFEPPWLVQRSRWES